MKIYEFHFSNSETLFISINNLKLIYNFDFNRILHNSFYYTFVIDIYDFILERNNVTNDTKYLSNEFVKATLQFSGEFKNIIK